MSDRTEEQQAAIARFESDYFPTLEKGIVSKDITRAMRHDWAILTKEPEVGLAVSVPPVTSAPEIAPVDPFEEAKLEAAVEMVGIREEPAPATPKVGKSRRNG